MTLSSTGDSWVLSSSPSSNYATDSVAKVVSKSGDNARALVRFTLPTIPAGCQVTSAQLRMFAGGSSAGRTLQAFRASGAWTETGVTWSNQPATAGAAATTASGSGWRQWSVRDQVTAMYAGTNHGFVIRDATENGGGSEQQLHTKEKAPDNPPQLIVTFG
jgi:large repetitive protein